MSKKANGPPDYALRNGRLLIAAFVLIFVGILFIGAYREYKQTNAKNCYVDSSAYDVQKYILYGKVTSADTVYRKKCFVKNDW